MAVLRHLISIDDLSNETIREIFRIADEMSKGLRTTKGLATGNILATIFYEPSTRTRLSFESAMWRLGGGVISCANMRDSSSSKGESLADMVRVVGGSYADCIVLRHDLEGASRVAAAYSNVPVINAGDGSHEHPTQTLCDLYTLEKEKGHLEGLTVTLCGDLRFSRTIHSLAYALARFGADLVLIPAPGLEMPEYVLRALQSRYGCQPDRVEASEFRQLAPSVDAVYLTPNRPHQLSLFTKPSEPHHLPDLVKKIDALYMTRAQDERYGALGTQADLPHYPVVDPAFLQSPRFRDTVVMHPLPRRKEISYDLDRDPRSLYFKQAERGVPIRMALMAVLLGRLTLETADTLPPPTPRGELYPGKLGVQCGHETCVSHVEDYVPPLFEILERNPWRLRCVYCEREKVGRYVASVGGRVAHPGQAPEARRIKPANLIVFEDASQAAAAGYTISAKDSDAASRDSEESSAMGDDGS